MRTWLLAAVAAAAISSPALARDQSQYVGIEGGILFDGDLEQDLRIDDGDTIFDYDNAFEIDLKPGVDIDAIVGYDYGMFRLEAEAGYKSLRADKVEIDDDLADELDLIDSDFDLDGSGSVLSVMVNGLLDFGNDDVAGYVGGGVGMARVKFAGNRDSSFGWQLIAGVRKALSPRLDIGLKYRYFRTAKLNFNDEFDDGETIFGIDGEGKLRTHSLLASLIFNLAPVPLPPGPPPPPLPPPPPATQTCYDGSVILATDVCPQPPAPPVYVPPPPPEPMPERG